MDAPLSRRQRYSTSGSTILRGATRAKDRRITPLRDNLVGTMRPAVVATLVATVLILLTGCANVAALVLGQVDARSAEFAVRSALGANRQRLAQQPDRRGADRGELSRRFGAALAWASFSIVTGALPLGAWADSAAPDWRVVTSTVAIAIVAAFLVSLVPTISLYRGDMRSVLNRARTGGIGGRGGRLENSLVIAQVALAVMIAAAAALLARSVGNMYTVEPGVRVEGVAVVDVMLAGVSGHEKREQMLTELTTALRELPGVESVGVAQRLPLRGGGYRAELRVDDRQGIDPDATEYES